MLYFNPFCAAGILGLALLPLAFSSASHQFGLDPNTQASSCWIECHSATINAVPLPSRELNEFYALTLNCQNPPYVDTLATCLAARCDSAPDAAYAAEYAESVCKRAGVKVKVQLPKYYLEAAQEYFTSEAYTSRGTRGVKNWGFGGVLLLSLLIIASLF